VVVCVCKFTSKDDLALRRPLRAMPRSDAGAEVEFWHEDEFEDVLLAIGARARPDRALPFVRALLADRLLGIETESLPWMSLSRGR